MLARSCGCMKTVPEQIDHSMRKEFVRESVTMALYLSLSLMAVLLAIPTDSDHVVEDPVGLLFLTAIGLLVAHLLASAVSSRLVSRGLMDAAARTIAFAQIVGGLVVVVLVMIPMVLFDAPTSIQAAEGLLLAFVAGLGYLAARQSNASVLRSSLYAGSVVVGVAIVLVLKAAVGH